MGGYQHFAQCTLHTCRSLAVYWGLVNETTAQDGILTGLLNASCMLNKHCKERLTRLHAWMIDKQPCKMQLLYETR